MFRKRVNPEKEIRIDQVRLDQLLRRICWIVFATSAFLCVTVSFFFDGTVANIFIIIISAMGTAAVINLFLTDK